MDQWLVRTSKNWIAGPYPKAQLCQMIQDGHLTLQDEVCAANGYWFFLHEREEVKNLLGIVPPAPSSEPLEEVTETHIEPDDETTDTEIRPFSVQNPGEKDESHTQDMSREGFSSSVSKDEQKYSPEEAGYFSRVEIMGQIERPSFWKGFIWVLLVVTGAVVFWVVRLVKF